MIAGVIVYFYLDSIIKTNVEKQSTNSLNLSTTLNSAHLALFGGELTLKDLQIASPQGFSAPRMFEMGKLNVGVDYGQLRNEPVRIKTITIDQPQFVLEQVDGKMNFKAVMDGMPKTDPNAKTMKVIIDDLTVSNAKVIIRPGNVPGIGQMQEMTVQVPSMTLKNIGNSDNAQNGAAVKDVVVQVATALANKAGDIGNLPAAFKGLLKSNLNDVAAKYGAEYTKQLSGITSSVQSELDKVAPGVDVKKAIPKDLKNPQHLVGGLLGGDKDKKKKDAK